MIVYAFMIAHDQLASWYPGEKNLVVSPILAELRLERAT